MCFHGLVQRCKETDSWNAAWPQLYFTQIPCRGSQGDVSLRWRHNDHDGVSNHQPHRRLLNRLFRRRSKKTSKLRVTGLCAGNSPGPVNSPHKWPVTRKMFPFDDVIMCYGNNLYACAVWSALKSDSFALFMIDLFNLIRTNSQHKGTKTSLGNVTINYTKGGQAWW